MLLTVEGVDLQPVGGGSPVRGPANAERVVAHVVGGQVCHVQVHCAEGAAVSPLWSRQANGGIGRRFGFLTCGSFSDQRGAVARVVLCQHLHIVGGSWLQVVQLVGSDIANEHFLGLIRS